MSYTRYKFNPVVARRVVEKALPDLKQFMQEHGATHVLVTGSSGACLLTLLAAHDIPAIFVRKDQDKSHGLAVEYWEDLPLRLKVVFLDDFIATGQTLDFATKKTSELVTEHPLRTFSLAGVYTLRDVSGTAYTNARKIDGFVIPHREWF